MLETEGLELGRLLSLARFQQHRQRGEGRDQGADEAEADNQAENVEDPLHCVEQDHLHGAGDDLAD